jgi:hypothetical protein
MRILRTTRALFRTMGSGIDGETVLTGSFNFIKAAQERNAENVRRISGGEKRNPVAKMAEISCTQPTHPRR